MTMTTVFCVVTGSVYLVCGTLSFVAYLRRRRR
jgi:hypothetical protein